MHTVRQRRTLRDVRRCHLLGCRRPGVSGLSKREMSAIIGPQPENPTTDLPRRVELGAGQRKIEVIGPRLEDVPQSHKGF
jgi:hypothetical protein